MSPGYQTSVSVKHYMYKCHNNDLGQLKYAAGQNFCILVSGLCTVHGYILLQQFAPKLPAETKVDCKDIWEKEEQEVYNYHSYSISIILLSASSKDGVICCTI